MAADDSNRYRGESLPTEPQPPTAQRFWIDRPEMLAQVTPRLREARVLAIDAEFVTVTRTEGAGATHRLALLQLAIPGNCFVIDAWRLADLISLQPVFTDRTVLKLFHGMGSDARVLADRQLVADHTLDLEAVSRSIFGQRESGLATMLNRAFGMRLDKSLQRSDWTRRPLPPAMIAYAARDAEVTLALYDWLRRNYGWAVALYIDGWEIADWAAIARWLQPFARGERVQSLEMAIQDAGLTGDRETLVQDCRTALHILRYPSVRSRVLRVAADLELIELEPEARQMLQALASEERAAAVRTLGKLRLPGAVDLVLPLLADPVADVRRAAQLALEWLNNPAPEQTPPANRYRAGSGRWVVETSGEDTPSTTSPSDWRSTLRAMFSPTPPDEESGLSEE